MASFCRNLDVCLAHMGIGLGSSPGFSLFKAGMWCSAVLQRIKMPEEPFPENSPISSAGVQEPRQGEHSLGKEDPPAATVRNFINIPKFPKQRGLFQA